MKEAHHVIDVRRWSNARGEEIEKSRRNDCNMSDSGNRWRRMRGRAGAAKRRSARRS